MFCEGLVDEEDWLMKLESIDLKQLGEKWVQKQIADDPTLLGLGDLILKAKERIQPRAGRLDLLLQDPETLKRYETEIQLGATRCDGAAVTVGTNEESRQSFCAMRLNQYPVEGTTQLCRVLLVLTVLGSPLWPTSAPCGDDDILFAQKNFADGGLAVGISGTLTGDGVMYKNNTRSISCIKDKGECIIASIEQIGDHQIGRLDYVYTMPITRWTELEIVAADEPNDWSCVRNTVFLQRKAETALWVQEPTNTAKPQCKTADSNVRHWTIEDSLGWKRLHGK